MVDLGIIGGSGLYSFAALENVREIELTTPYGAPSDSITMGELSGRKVAFLARHGRGHRLSPSEVPAAANIFALKSLGVTEIISVSAVGSLREELRPGDLVLPDQLVDLTRGQRRSTFFGDGLVVHIPFADPFCKRLRSILSATVMAREEGAGTRGSGTYLCIEGPQFSTRAESELYRLWGMDVIGMTAAPEAKLAREAEMCFATLALVTDYDCWRPGDKAVTADMVATVMSRNVAAAQAIIGDFARSPSHGQPCSCRSALEQAVLSDASDVSDQIRSRVDPLVGRYLR